MRLMRPSVIYSVMFVVVYGFVLLTAWGWPAQPRLLPLVVGIPCLILALVQLVKALLFEAPGPPRSGRELMDITVDHDIGTKDLVAGLVIVGWVAGFFLSIWLFGFLIAIPMFMFAYVRFQARANLLRSTFMAIGMLTLTFIVFDRVMRLPWPEGWLFQ